jgi:hypothetical protein
MSESDPDAEAWSCEVTEPPVTIRRRTTERSQGQVLTYRLRNDGGEPVIVRFRQPIPAEPAVADVGFRVDAAPAEWNTEDGTVQVRASVDPGEGEELVLGITFETADGAPALPPDPIVDAVEPDREAGADGPRGRTWDHPPQGADQAALESAVESVDVGRSRPGIHGTDAGAAPGSSAESGPWIDLDGPSDGRDGADGGEREPPTRDSDATAGTASEGSTDDAGTDATDATDAATGAGDATDLATVEALREAVADRNEELMRLRAELAVARSERADLRETVRDLRETVDALVDYGGDAPEAAADDRDGPPAGTDTGAPAEDR